MQFGEDSDVIQKNNQNVSNYGILAYTCTQHGGRGDNIGHPPGQILGGYIPHPPRIYAYGKCTIFKQDSDWHCGNLVIWRADHYMPFQLIALEVALLSYN